MAHGCNESPCPVCSTGADTFGVDRIRRDAGLKPAKYPCSICGKMDHGAWFKRTLSGAAVWFCMTHGSRISRDMRRKVLKSARELL